MMAAGYSMDNSLMFMMVMNVGAVVGIVGGRVLADRFHLKPVLMCLGTMGAIVAGLMGFQSNQFLLYILVFLAGAASIGSQMARCTAMSRNSIHWRYVRQALAGRLPLAAWGQL